MARDGVSVDVVGLDKAIADVGKFKIIKREAIRIAVIDETLNVERTAKEFVTVVTGFLKNSIRSELSALLSGMTFSGIVTADAPYARRVELGFMGTDKLGRRYNQFPQPYLYPAWLLGQRDLIVRVGKILATPIRTI